MYTNCFVEVLFFYVEIYVFEYEIYIFEISEAMMKFCIFEAVTSF